MKRIRPEPPIRSLVLPGGRLAMNHVFKFYGLGLLSLLLLALACAFPSMAAPALDKTALAERLRLDQGSGPLRR
jgi:hypothetical protein